MIGQLIVSTGTRLTDKPFSYRIPKDLEGHVQVGQSVVVPFGKGNRLRQAIVVAIQEEPAGQETYTLKEIDHIVEGQPLLPPESMGLAFYMIDHDLSDYAAAFAAVMPPGTVGSYRPLNKAFYRLTEAGEAAEPAKTAYRQQAVLDYLRKAGEEESSVLLKASGASSSTLKTLEDKGWIQQESRRFYRRQGGDFRQGQRKILSPAQEAVYQRIQEEPGAYLICGVTGSGKTEIYLQLVQDALERGEEAIVLVPEISLTPQTLERFEGRFGQQVAVLHSRLTQNERFEEWEKIASGQVKIAIGARSAIFAPFQHLGLIVIDEEHDGSYISDKNPKYHTYDIARFRADRHQARLVLGSATPSLETLYRAELGEIERLDLPDRVRGAMPAIEIVDMREELKANNRSMFSRTLYEQMQATLDRGEQVILFLNKRGHTSYVFCRACGYVYRCDACDVAMTYHKHRDQLICHYCGREKPYAHVCPQCGSTAIREFGSGTEKLEEEVRRLFPGRRVVRADADTMGAKTAYNRVYQEMLDRKIDILLGTQMIAKGFDFPGVTLVGVMAADITLNLPDLRAEEKCFQLLTQVAGRAGRGDLPGHVVIQTYKPDNPAIQAAASHDVDGFYQHAMDYRRALNYPPLCHELLIRIQGANRPASLDKGRVIRAFLDQAIRELRATRPGADFTLEGPVPAVIERVNRKYRFVLLARSQDRSDLEALGRAIIDRFPTSKEINVVVALDPEGIY